ncbi:MAG TPA: hypothetical protein VIJ58_12535, partial [Candidatus Dormibacteraeota bacterium]
ARRGRRIHQGDPAAVAHVVDTDVVAAGVGNIGEVACRRDPARGRLAVGDGRAVRGDRTVVVNITRCEVPRRIDQFELVRRGEGEGEGNAAVGVCSVSLGARGPVAVSDRLPGGADFDVETVEGIGLTATARECDSNGRGLAVKPTRMTNPARADRDPSWMGLGVAAGGGVPYS